MLKKGCVMKENKTKAKKWRMAKVISIIAAVLLIVYGILSYNDAIYTHAINTEIRIGMTNESVKRLEFCIARDIKACSAEAIETWNEEHPDDMFTPISLEQISEQAIEAVDATGIHSRLFYTPRLR